MSIETDDRGRIYLPKGVREKHGERFRVLDLPDRVVLIPIADDPLQAVRIAVGDTFEGKSIEEIKAEIVEAAKEEADAEVREREERRQAAESASENE